MSTKIQSSRPVPTSAMQSIASAVDQIARSGDIELPIDITVIADSYGVADPDTKFVASITITASNDV